MKNIPWKKIGLICLWVISLAAVVSSLAFASRKQEVVPCKKINIQVTKEDENYFINKQDVYALLVSNGDSLIGNAISTVNIKKLERLIAANKYVKQAEIFMDLTGGLFVNVKQRKPVLRIFTADNHSFYIDEDGLKMPLSTNYAAKVLMANGFIQEIYGGLYDSVKNPIINDIYNLTRFIRNNGFWDAQIEQVFVEENLDLVLIPRVGNHKIIFGSIDKMEDKFANLFTFYTKALPKVGWDTYSTISVKFDGQIVATKSGVQLVLPKLLADSAKVDSTEKLKDIHI